MYPRFLVDSGGVMGDGVSVYINDQTLFCEVATGDATWKVYTLLAFTYSKLTVETLEQGVKYVHS